MAGLPEFDRAVAEFEAAHRQLDAYLANEDDRLVSPPIRMRAGELASDIQVLCLLLREAHVRAVGASVEQTASVPVLLTDSAALGTWQDLSGLSATLKVVYKALFYFVRAYHDALCAVLQELIGQKAGEYTSMFKALKPAKDGKRKPFAQLLEDTDSGYSRWFMKWRERRNEVKRGVNFGIRGPERDLGVSFSTFDNDGGLVSDLASEPVRPKEVAEALNWSSWLVLLALSLAQGGKTGPVPSQPL